MSPPDSANWRHRCSWSAPSTLAQKWPALRMRGHELDDFAGQNSTSGGSSDSDVNDCAVRPTGIPSSMAVMIVMPVQKCPSTVRMAASSRASSSPIAAATLPITH